MDGLRYYVGSLILCTVSMYAAQEYGEKELLSPKLKMHVVLPTGSKLNASSRTFYIPITNTTVTIAAVRNIFEKEIDRLAHQEPTCCCGGPCADIRAAKVLIQHHGLLHIVYLGKEPKDTDTLNSLEFNQKEDALYAKY